MSRDSNLLKVEGIVEESLPGLFFRIKARIGAEDVQILGHPAGKMKLHRIRIIPGDKVLVEIYEVNDKRGRLVRRL